MNPACVIVLIGEAAHTLFTGHETDKNLGHTKHMNQSLTAFMDKFSISVDDKALASSLEKTSKSGLYRDLKMMNSCDRRPRS